MQKADYWLRLMKQRTDAIAATDEKLQQFLMWVNEKSLSVEVPYKPAAVRAFYFVLDRTLDQALERALDQALFRTLALDPARIPSVVRGAVDLASVPSVVRALEVILKPAFDLTLDHSFDLVLDIELDCARTFVRRALDCTLVRALDRALYLELFRALDLTLFRALNLALDPELRQALQELQAQLPDPDGDKKIFKQWWEVNGQAWTEELRMLMIEHGNIGHNWQFSEQQRKLLTQYYYGNQLVADCLNSASNVTPAVRSQIEETLLLPIAEIEKRRSC